MRRFMAAAEALRTAPIFAQCGMAAPAFPDRLGAMDLFEAFQGAAQAVQQLDEAIGAHADSAEMQGMFSGLAFLGFTAALNQALKAESCRK